MEAQKTLEITCPGCSTVYEIPIEYCGKDAVCANEQCGIMFNIPPLAEIRITETQSKTKESFKEFLRETVKIKRDHESTGMIPELVQKQGFDTSNFILTDDFDTHIPPKEKHQQTKEHEIDPIEKIPGHAQLKNEQQYLGRQGSALEKKNQIFRWRKCGKH